MKPLFTLFPARSPFYTPFYQKEPVRPSDGTSGTLSDGNDHVFVNRRYVRNESISPRGLCKSSPGHQLNRQYELLQTVTAQYCRTWVRLRLPQPLRSMWETLKVSTEPGIGLATGKP